MGLEGKRRCERYDGTVGEDGEEEAVLSKE